MTPLSQRDKRWGSIKLGFSDTTIADYGCTITALSIILGTTPDVTNERLKAVQGYAQGNLVIWAKLEEAFPGIKIKRVWTYDNEDVKKNVPNVLVEVDGKPIGGYRHWVVYIGNGKMIDPWDGKEKSTASYPSPVSYCVIGGKWNKPSPQPENMSIPKETFEELVTKATTLDKAGERLNIPTNRDIFLAEMEKFSKYEETIRSKENEISTLKERLETVNRELTELNTRHIGLQNVHSDLETTAKQYKTTLDDQEKKLTEQGQSIQQLSSQVQYLQSQINKNNDFIKKIMQHLVKFFVKLFVRG